MENVISTLDYHKRAQINADFKARTLSRADYSLALQAIRTKMRPEIFKTHRSIDDSALTLAIRCFGSVDGLRIYNQIKMSKFKRGLLRKGMFSEKAIA